LDPQYGLCKFHLHESCIDVSFFSYQILIFYRRRYDRLIFCFLVSDSSFIPPLIYAAMGSSKDIAIGPVAVVSLLLGSLLQNEVDSTNNKEEYLRLAFTATFFAGITQATLGFLRYAIQQYLSKIDTQIQVGVSKL
jgi:hypothetical protein